MEAQSSDFLEECAEGGSGDGGSQAFDESGVLLEGRVESLSNREQVYGRCC